MEELLRKYIAGDASEQEKLVVMKWLRQDKQHLLEYKRQRKLYDMALWQTDGEALVEMRRQGGFRRTLGILARVAAVILLMVASAYLYSRYGIPGVAGESQTIVVPPGQHAELYLADGTHVWLNSGSKLTFPGQFAKNTRRVTLDGEGYFAVTSNARWPFIVETNRCGVKALGTEFNVLAYHNDSIWETALLEGRVEILQKDSEKALATLEPGSMIKLDKNQLIKSKIQTNDYFRWREGLICFKDISLRDMIEKLKLYYDVNFIVNNRQILDTHYTGKFRTNDGIEHVMRVLRLSNEFTYVKDDENNTITIN